MQVKAFPADTVALSNMNFQWLQSLNAGGRANMPRGKTIVGRGVNLEDINKMIDITINDEDRSGHTGVLGTTRVGKTRLVEAIVEQDIKKKFNVVIFDPKGDNGLFSKVVQVAAEAGRLNELMLLTPIFPDNSIMIDPLAYYYMLDELTDHVISGIKAKEDYFIAIAQEVTQALVSGLSVQARARNESLKISFHDIKVRSDYLALRRFSESLEHVVGASEVVQSIEQILTSPQDFFSKVSSSLRTTLSALTTGSTGQIIGKCLQNEFVRRFEHGEGVILYCNTGAMLARRTAHIIGRVLLSMIQSMVGRFYATGRKLNPPLCIHMDEGHNMLYPGVQSLFNMSGGAGVFLHFYTQSLAQIEEEVGLAPAKSVMDNINNWIYMLVNHPQTAQHVEDMSPIVQKYQPILSFGGGISVREVEEKQILANKVLSLPKREFYMRSYGNMFKGMTCDVKDSEVEVLLHDIATTWRPPTLPSEAGAEWLD